MDGYPPPPAQRKRKHHAVVESIARCRIKWACVRANWDQEYGPVHRALQLSMQTGAYATIAALRMTEFPCPVRAADLTAFATKWNLFMASQTRHLSANAAMSFEKAISHFQSDVGTGVSSMWQSKLHDMARAVLDAEFLQGCRDPDTYNASLRLRGSMMALLRSPSHESGISHNLSKSLMSRWATMLKLALSHDSVR